MKKRNIISVIIAAAILLSAILVAVFCFPHRETTTDTEEVTEAEKQESESIFISPITEDTERDTDKHQADVELDIGSIERNTDPVILDTKIEYGTKEGKENEKETE